MGMGEWREGGRGVIDLGRLVRFFIKWVLISSSLFCCVSV